MAESQPPESLRQIAERAIDEFVKQWNGEPGYTEDLASAVLAALFEACEVREERRIVIDDERASGLPVNGLWITPPVMVGTHHFLLGRYPSARVERRFVIETEPEPVSSTEIGDDRD